MVRALMILSAVGVAGLALAAQQPPAAAPPKKADPLWAIGVQGGAGRPPEGLSATDVKAYKRGVILCLEKALRTGRDMLAEGKTSVEAVEAVIRVMEDDPWLNAGHGAVMNIDGDFEMQASIMDGKTRDAGGVAGVDTVRNPISLARAVMEQTDFFLLAGDGAESFAVEAGVETVKTDYFRTEMRDKLWRNARRDLGLPMPGEEIPAETPKVPDAGIDPELRIGTVGCVALDQLGNLAAGTSTGGMAHRRAGRVGDAAIVGVGTFADNRTCAVSCSGTGEEFMRAAAGSRVSMLIQYRNLTLKEAVTTVVTSELPPESGGLIAVNRKGEVIADWNRQGMRRAIADSDGTFSVLYWD